MGRNPFHNTNFTRLNVQISKSTVYTYATHLLCRYLGDALKLLGRLTSAMTTESSLWSVYADLTALPAAGAGPFKPRQLRQRAAACAAQGTGRERDAAAAAEVVAAGLRFAAEAVEYAALGDNDTQAVQLMSSAKMSLKGMVAKVKVRIQRFNSCPLSAIPSLMCDRISFQCRFGRTKSTKICRNRTFSYTAKRYFRPK